jgi:hypothetical protein
MPEFKVSAVRVRPAGGHRTTGDERQLGTITGEHPDVADSEEDAP